MANPAEQAAAAPAGETAPPSGTGTGTARRKPLPLIGKLPYQEQIKRLGILMAVLLLLAGVMVVLNVRSSATDARYIGVSGEMRTLTQRLAKTALLAAQGNELAFNQLTESRDAFTASLDALTKGGERGGVSIPPSPDAIQPILGDVARQWDGVQRHSTTILAEQASLVEIGKAVQLINAKNAELLDATEQLVALLVQSGSAPRNQAAGHEMVMLTQRIAKNANVLLAADSVDPDTAFLLSKDAGQYADLLRGLDEGSESLRLAPNRNNDVREQLNQLRSRYTEYLKNVQTLIGRLPNFVASKTSGAALFNESEALLAGTDTLFGAYQERASGRFVPGLLGGLFAIAAVGCLVLLGRVILDEADRRRLESEEANRRSQAAILRLLDEMSTLADGDLTVQADVTEDVTGSIADSVNYVVEELRRLVTGIIRATAQVTAATGQAQNISNQLLGAAQQQAGEIRETGEAVVRMTQSIEQVSLRASESAGVAAQSLAAAEQGTQAVQNAISGMNSIREQIQETSKRIKRLGESSQEIGEIVDLISDITEQTNVLALNAAIQASSAGPAGRGFTVVAEEVQRLAERSAEATKQIGTIVKTIQADTQDTVAAMERSTQGVVEGTRLADAAGQTLAQIEAVSKKLAGLIEQISGQTRDQAEAAARVNENMTDILRITDLTTEGTRKTAESTSELTELAFELKQSVAGFKLPPGAG
jgi:twitching motility protein PilJ